jgi:pimeloyl-ACP methyl ester carboxylesterase
VHEYQDAPNVRIHLIEGVGHAPQVEKPNETASLILGFAEGGR